MQHLKENPHLPMRNPATRIAGGTIALITLLGACAPSSTGMLEQPIIGGTIDKGDPSVVLVYWENTPGSTYFHVCTGTVVSPHVVLTAAHCINPAPAAYSILIASSLDEAETNDWYDVSGLIADPAFNASSLFLGHDIGVVITVDALPVTPIPVNRTPLQISQIGSALRLVGYGRTTAGSSAGTGTKRQVTATLTGHNSLFILAGDPTHNTCSGDSGGPALMTIAGTERVVGVTSYGDNLCAAEGKYTRVDSYLDFIDPIIQAHDPSPLDMAVPPATHDMDEPHDMAAPHDLTGAARAVGSPCDQAADCESLLCLASENGRYCSTACNENELYVCPPSLDCEQTDAGTFCLPKSSPSSGGCSLARQTSDPTPLFCCLALLFVAWRRGRQRRR